MQSTNPIVLAICHSHRASSVSTLPIPSIEVTTTDHITTTFLKRGDDVVRGIRSSLTLLKILNDFKRMTF